MKKISIIGSGVLGLSIAEYLSRGKKNGNEIQIISSNNPLAGSYAAAANLATKGQLFGRDKHFQVKLDAKKCYQNWIKNLILEVEVDLKIKSVFKLGLGIDFFSSHYNRDKQYKRVKQDDDELKNKNLPLDFILKEGERKIKYQQEAWVNSFVLMQLLTDVLVKRKVNFINKIFTKNELEKLSEEGLQHKIIFCTGAWTESLLKDLEIPIPDQMKKAKRITVGTTFYGNNIFENYSEEYVLMERVAENMKTKVTMSGPIDNQSISASTLKIDDINVFDETDLLEKNKELIKLCSESFANDPYLAKEKIKNLEYKTGLRVGYGHSELVIEKLNIKCDQLTGYVCAGAHKSGFLFAPMVGTQLEKLF
ncbi:FAD-dependent oxidoreductase [Fluviispira sanaruensis]|uniref:Glycine oxidase ThiO n=1 Tax=Fluviispira sanaruensis TaxID=2493639 RepID=A0A4P2VPS9_FLUSA|nr:FAD-dependent oxidoreductase [Fluviispira sanaruensis]BBH54234.1 glycine oxidase ThiO [Fluviispira sanaruensis]